MKRTYTGFLIALLPSILLLYGCSPSPRNNISDLDNRIENLSSDIHRKNIQLENEIWAIKEDVNGLRSSIGGRLEKLRSDINKSDIPRSDIQREDEIASIKEDMRLLSSNIYGRLEKLNSDMYESDIQLTNDIQTVLKHFNSLQTSLDDRENLNSDFLKNAVEFESKIKSIEADLNDFESSLDDRFEALRSEIQIIDDQLNNQISVLLNLVDTLQSDLDNKVHTLNVALQGTNEQLKDSLDVNASHIRQEMDKQQLYQIIAALVLLVVIAAVFLFLKYRISRISKILHSGFTSKIVAK